MKRGFWDMLLHRLLIPFLLWIRTFVVRYTSNKQTKRTEKRYLDLLASTEDHLTWHNTAVKLDTLRGIDNWKWKATEERYCYVDAVVYETNVIYRLLDANHLPSMGDFIRSMLHRRGNGIGSPLLFRYYTGTKGYVEEYEEAVVELIRTYVGRRTFQRQRSGSCLSSSFTKAMMTRLTPSRRDSCRLVAASTPRGSSSSSMPSSSTTATPGKSVATATTTMKPQKVVTSAFLETMVTLAESNDLESPDAVPSLEERRFLIQETITSYGRTALMLSGGASLGMYHTGVARALLESDLLPNVISGSSAGAIIAGIICTRTPTELKQMFLSGSLSLGRISLNAFETSDSPSQDIRRKVDRLVQSGAFMDISILKDCLRENYGDLTFLEAYHATGKVLNVSVANSRPGDHIQKHMLLNYVTTPHVVVWSAVAASCAMPGLFTAVQLLQKQEGTVYRAGPSGPPDFPPYLPGQLWFDGSVARDLPKEELATTFNVNYFIVSQTNPHVIPFFRSPPSPLVHKKRTGILKSLWFGWCTEFKYWLEKLYRFEILPKTGGAEVPYLMATQDYYGHITIFPIGSVWTAIPDFINLTSNPDAEHMEYVISSAQRRTWPHMNQIKWTTLVERVLQDELKWLNQQIKEAKSSSDRLSGSNAVEEYHRQLTTPVI